MAATEDRRRDRWQRFAPYNESLNLIIPEIADDIDEIEELLHRIDRRVGKLIGIAGSLLVSVCTGVLFLALNLIQGG